MELFRGIEAPFAALVAQSSDCTILTAQARIQTLGRGSGNRGGAGLARDEMQRRFFEGDESSGG